MTRARRETASLVSTTPKVNFADVPNNAAHGRFLNRPSRNNPFRNSRLTDRQRTWTVIAVAALASILMRLRNGRAAAA